VTATQSDTGSAGRPPAALVETFLTPAERTVVRWSADQHVARRQALLTDVAAGLAEHPEHRQPALRTLASCAVGEEAAGRDVVDLAWRLLARRAALGVPDDAAVQALLDRDPDPDAAVRVLGVKAARADAAAKDEVWAEMFEKRSVPAGTAVFEVAGLVWQPGQTDLLLPYPHRYLDEAARLSGGGMLVLMSLMRATTPTVADDDVLARMHHAKTR
jgi:aminopeptidase N